MVTAALLAACGGGSDEPGAPTLPTIPAAMHIGAEIDDIPVLMNYGPEGWWASKPHAILTAAQGKHDSPTALVNWSASIIIQSAPKAGSTYDCAKNEAVIELGAAVRANASAPWTYRLFSADHDAGSACSITVEAVSAEEISGRFSATAVYPHDTSDVHHLVNGTFRIPASTDPEPD